MSEAVEARREPRRDSLTSLDRGVGQNLEELPRLDESVDVGGLEYEMKSDASACRAGAGGGGRGAPSRS